MSESSSRPERRGAFDIFVGELNLNLTPLSAVSARVHLTCLLCKWGEHRGGRDLQAVVILRQSWEHHAAQRRAEGEKCALFWCGDADKGRRVKIWNLCTNDTETQVKNKCFILLIVQDVSAQHHTQQSLCTRNRWAIKLHESQISTFYDSHSLTLFLIFLDFIIKRK